MKEILRNIAKVGNYTIEEIESDKDHIHIMIDYSFKENLYDLINTLKLVSTTKIWKAYEERLSKIYTTERTIWSDGYFTTTLGHAGSEVTKEYIRNQKNREG